MAPLLCNLRLMLAAALLLALGSVVANPSAGFQPGRSPGSTRPSPAKVLHLRIRGDLDCMKLARDLASELDRARADGVSLLLVELDGDRWRADVVWAMAQQVRSSGIPAAAWLHDSRDRRIGSGQAILALLISTPARAAATMDDPPPQPAPFIGPRMSIGLEPGEDLRATAPDDTDWEAVDRELQGAAWLALRARGVDTELAAALLAPSVDAWAVPPEDPSGTGRWRLTIRRSAAEAHASLMCVVECSPAYPSPRVRLSGELAVDMGLCGGTARTPGEVLSGLGTGGGGRSVREISSGLADARREVNQAIISVETGATRADQILRDIPRASEPDHAARKTRAGRAALPIIEESAAMLLRAESLLTEYPELLREIPPTRTPVGQDAASLKTTWRTLFQQKRDELTRLSARAREYAGK